MSAMNEYQRMQYLDAMGVDTFIPRFSVPNAKASLQCVVPDTSTEQAIAANEQHVNVRYKAEALSGASAASSIDQSVNAETLKSLNDGLNSVLSDLDLGGRKSPALNTISREEKTSEPVPEPAPAIDHVSEPAEFNLALWCVESGLQIIDSRQVEDALPTDTLLRNMLSSAGLLSAVLPNAEIQSWPIIGSHDKDQSWQAANAMMFDFLSFRFEQRPVKAFVIFGESAAKAVLGEQCVFSEKVNQIVDAEQYGIKAIIFPSLRDMLYAPSTKKSVWSLLKPLSQ